MWPQVTQALRLAPEQASPVAGQVDALFLFLVAITVFFTGLIFLLVVVFGKWKTSRYIKCCVNWIKTA